MTKSIILAALVAVLGLVGALRATQHPAPATANCCDGGACCDGGPCCATR